MQEVYSGQANVVSLSLINKSTGAAITADTANFYLIAWDGDNAGKWYKGSTETWESSESIAGAATHKVRGKWYLSLASAVWTAGVKYELYAVDSGGLHISISEDIICVARPVSSVAHSGGGGTGIITRAEAKSILGISNTDFDTQIDNLIAPIQSLICEYCNNNFISDKVYMTENTFAVVNGGGESDTITDSDEGFVTDLIKSGTIYIEGSYHNDGHHVVSNVAAGTLTLSTAGVVVDEDEDEPFTIYQVFWPRGIKIPAAELIGFELEKDRQAASVSLNGYSVNFPTGIPKHIQQKLNPWRRLRIT